MDANRFSTYKRLNDLHQINPILYWTMTYKNPVVLIEMTTILNKIDVQQRFAKRQKNEYNVFSMNIVDAQTVTKWVGVEKPEFVLMDPESYDFLLNKRIEWIFDEEKTLMACKIIES